MKNFPKILGIMLIFLFLCGCTLEQNQRNIPSQNIQTNISQPEISQPEISEFSQPEFSQPEISPDIDKGLEKVPANLIFNYKFSQLRDFNQVPSDFTTLPDEYRANAVIQNVYNLYTAQNEIRTSEKTPVLIDIIWIEWQERNKYYSRIFAMNPSNPDSELGMLWQLNGAGKVYIFDMGYYLRTKNNGKKFVYNKIPCLVLPYHPDPQAPNQILTGDNGRAKIYRIDLNKFEGYIYKKIPREIMTNNDVTGLQRIELRRKQVMDKENFVQYQPAKFIYQNGKDKKIDVYLFGNAWILEFKLGSHFWADKDTPILVGGDSWVFEYLPETNDLRLMEYSSDLSD